MKSYFRLFFYIWKMTVIRKLAYPVDFFLIFLGVSGQMVLTIIFAQVIYGRFDSLAGLNFHQILLIIGTAMVLDGLAWNSFRHGLGRLDRDIITGRLNFFIVKPKDSQFLQNFQAMDLEDLSRVGIGMFLILSNLNHTPELNMAHIALYLLLVIEAMIILWAVFSLISSIAFRLLYIPAFYTIGDTLTKMIQYPGDIFKGIAKIIFMSVLPIIFIATVPGKTLAGIVNPWYTAGSTVIAVIFYILARKVWQYAIKRYTGAGG